MHVHNTTEYGTINEEFVPNLIEKSIDHNEINVNEHHVEPHVESHVVSHVEPNLKHLF